jgi:hypothetical protein
MKWSAVVVLLLLLSLALPVFAQDGGDISEEDAALLERVFTALEGVESYESFTIESTVSENIYMASMMDGTTTTTINAAVIGGETPNVSATVEVNDDASLQILDTSTTTNSTTTGEIAVVDGVVYVNGAYSGSDPVDGVPEGWIVFDPEGELPGFGLLDLLLLNEDLYDWLLPEYKLEDLATGLVETSVEQDTLEDGTAVDIITFSLGATGQTESGDYYGIINEVTIKLDENDLVHEYSVNTTIGLAADAALTNVSMRMQTSSAIVITNINEPLEPVAAPIES